MVKIFWAAALAIFLGAALALTAGAQPPPVPRLTERTLDKASYVALATQWKSYMDQHGESADGLVNLGMAYDYSQELEAATVVARRAVKLEPDNPRALAFLGKMLATYKADEDEAMKVLQHCRDVAPDYPFGMTMLATAYMRRGELSEAEDVYRTIFDQRLISRPLQDYAYNTLVALPKGAILITWGDNDTHPVLALQAGMDFHRDVIVLNQSLLNLPAYAEAQFNRHSAIRPDYNIARHKVKMVDGQPTLLSGALIAKMIEEHKAAVYLTASMGGVVNPHQTEKRHLEGMNWSASPQGMSAEESAQLFFGMYRLDSATDWTVPWSLAPNEAALMGNYASSMVELAEAKGISRDTRARLLVKAATIAEFHGNDRLSMTIETLQKR